jgi:hypothetical protein
MEDKGGLPSSAGWGAVPGGVIRRVTQNFLDQFGELTGRPISATQRRTPGRSTCRSEPEEQPSLLQSLART